MSPVDAGADPAPRSAAQATAGPLCFRAAIEGLPPYSAGRSGRDVVRQRGWRGEIAALAANEGPYGPFPGALKAIQENTARTNRYPESGFKTLRQRLSQHLEVPLERVAVAAGGMAVLHHVSLALLEPGSEIIQSVPTFHAYGLEARKQGAVTVSVPVRADGSYDLEGMLEKIGPKTRLIYVCNPNNPTGGIVRRDELLRFVHAVPCNVAILVDEAYFEYVDDAGYPDTIRDPAFHLPNLITLRTFSKAYGLAGLRVGYAVGSPAIVDAITKVQSNYEVTSLSLYAALASLDDVAELERRRALNREGRAALAEGLRRCGYEPLPSHANFLCARVGEAKRVAAALEAHGVIVRPLDAMGDPTSIRITVGTEAENRQALAAIDIVLNESK
jgi:histidinol-phosphate aminotransferase